MEGVEIQRFDGQHAVVKRGSRCQIARAMPLECRFKRTRH
jgi:hypothetical protein